MKRRELCKTLGLVSGGLISGLPVISRAQNKTKFPNIVLIMADDLGYRELGCYGQKKIETPNIDKLAKEGMKLTQFYSGSAVCGPTRCNLMTGMHGGHALVRDNNEVKNPEPGIYGGQWPLKPGTQTIATLMKKQGYATGAFGKWGLGGIQTTGDPLKQGFDRFYGFNCQRHAHNLYPKYLVSDHTNEKLEGNTRGLTGDSYGPQMVADQMLKFVKANKDKPFFLYYPTVIPHLALQAPEKDIAQYKGKWKETPYKAGSYLSHPTPRACYAAMISFMDRQIGRLMALLKEQGNDDNTIVIFTSDNGPTHLNPQVDVKFFESAGELRGLKGSLHEGGIRVPFIARWNNKIKPGTTSDHASAHYDLLETLAEISGAEVLKKTDGISMLPTLLDKKQAKHKYLFWDFGGYGGQLAVRMGKWKGIKKKLRKNANAKLELYDLENDIGEKNNLAAEHPEIAEQIEKIMLDAREKPEIEKFRFGKYKN